MMPPPKVPMFDKPAASAKAMPPPVPNFGGASKPAPVPTFGGGKSEGSAPPVPAFNSREPTGSVKEQIPAFKEPAEAPSEPKPSQPEQKPLPAGYKVPEWSAVPKTKGGFDVRSWGLEVLKGGVILENVPLDEQAINKHSFSLSDRRSNRVSNPFSSFSGALQFRSCCRA